MRSDGDGDEHMGLIGERDETCSDHSIGIFQHAYLTLQRNPFSKQYYSVVSGLHSALTAQILVAPMSPPRRLIPKRNQFSPPRQSIFHPTPPHSPLSCNRCSSRSKMSCDDDDHHGHSHSHSNSSKRSGPGDATPVVEAQYVTSSHFSL